MSILRGIYQSRNGRVGLAILLGLGFVSLAAPLLAPHDPLRISGAVQLQPPSLLHPLGTDNYGRDVLSRVLFAGRASLTVATAAVTLGLLVSLALGLTAGWSGGLIDESLMRALDVFFAIPSVLLAIALVAVLGPGSANVALAIGIVFVPPLTRVVRAAVLVVRNRPYVEAAQLAGSSPLRLVWRHLLPNSIAPVVVMATILLGSALIIEAALSFLGLGLVPPEPSWGEMVNSGRAFMSVAPWVVLFPIVVLAIAVIGINLLGDGLREALDPTLY